MKFWHFAAALGLLVVGVSSAHVSAQDGNGCPGGSYNIVLTPDGGTVTVLFDDFVVEADGTGGQAGDRKTCRLHVPLNLPPDTSVGVYKVDYRGFASLAQRQQFELSVSYGFNGGHDHDYRRQIRGQSEGDFAFSQTIGAGLMRRIGWDPLESTCRHASLSIL